MKTSPKSLTGMNTTSGFRFKPVWTFGWVLGWVAAWRAWKFDKKNFRRK